MTQHYPLGSFAAEARVTARSSLDSVRNATQLAKLKTARHSTSPQWDQHESSRMSGGQVVMTDDNGEAGVVNRVGAGRVFKWDP